MADARGRRRGVRAGAAPVAGAIAIATLVAVGSTGALSTTACATHTCDFSYVNYKDGKNQPSQGAMIDDDTWESNAIDDRWIDYPGQRLSEFHLPPELRGREMLEMLAFVSADALPNQKSDPAPNWALASGNLGEFLSRHCTCYAHTDGTLNYPYDCDDTFQVKNDTCGQYYVRVVVRFARGRSNVCRLNDDAGTPVGAIVPGPDASSDASPLDAAPGAPHDGPLD